MLIPDKKLPNRQSQKTVEQANHLSRFTTSDEVISRVPYWARSSNPIVRRHLGLYWRTLPPQFKPIFQVVGIWAFILMLTIPFPFVFQLTMPMVVVGILALPIALIVYAHILYQVAVTSSTAMAEELRNNTMPLLMTTPMSLDEIFLGKIAASIWKRIDDLMLIALAASIFSVPLLVMNYADVMNPTEYPILAQVVTVLSLIVSLARLALEPIMVGSIGVMIGAFTLYRSAAISSTIALSGFYFLFMTLISRIPTSDQVLFQMFADLVVPIVAPMLITWICLRVANYIVTRD